MGSIPGFMKSWVALPTRTRKDEEMVAAMKLRHCERKAHRNSGEVIVDAEHAPLDLPAPYVG